MSLAEMKKQIYKHKTILLILILASGLRLTSIDQSLWLDEAIEALAVRDNSYTTIITEYIKADFHPPLHYLSLKFWTNIFGYSEFALRSLSVLFGVATVYLTYLIAKTLESGRKYFSTIVALLMATSQFHVYYSQEARMYAMAAFLAALAIYSFIIVFHREDKNKNNLLWWAIFSFSVTALIFTDYVPVFMLPSFGVYAILAKKKWAWWKKLLLSFLPLLVLGAMWLPTFLVQAEGGNWLMSTLPAWKQVGGTNFKQAALVWMKFVFGRLSFSNKPLYYSLVGMSSIPFALLLIKSLKKWKKTPIIWMWLVVPLALGFIASFWFPAFVYFRFLYVLPAFYLLVAYGVSEVRDGKLQALAVLILMSINLLGLGIYYFDQNQQREQWKQAVSLIERSVGKDEIVMFEYPQPFSPYRWYATGKVVAEGVTDSISADPKKTHDITIKKTKDARAVYYFEYLRDLSDPNRYVEKALKEKGFKVDEVINFNGVGQVFYYTK